MGIENLVEKARSDVERAAGVLGQIRTWLEANIDEHDAAKCRIRVLVLQGIPPKGIVIVNYYMGTAQAFDVNGKQLSRYSVDDDEEIREWRLRCEDRGKLPSKRSGSSKAKGSGIDD
jgi:hypothetical protein